LGFAACALAQMNQAPQCGYLLGWELSSDVEGWAAQSLDLVSTELSPMVNVTLGDDEFAVAAIHARPQRSIFFFSTEHIYQYQVDEGSVVNTQDYDNSEGAFVPIGYDDVTGHFWGSQWDDEEEMYFAARYDPGNQEITQFNYVIQDFENSTLYLDEATKTFYHLTTFNDNADGNAYITVNVTNFAYNYHYNVSAAFFETEWVFATTGVHSFPNGNVLLVDSGENYIVFNLASGEYNYVDPDVIDETVFFPAPEPFYNYAFGFYNFDSSCETEGVLCLGFYDTLDFSVASLGPVTFDDVDVIHANDFFYYSDGC